MASPRGAEPRPSQGRVPKGHANLLKDLVELTGFEPVTS